MDHHNNHPSSFPQPPATTQTQTEADRLLGIAEKLLLSRDLTGSREFALLAQETESLSEGSDQILAITDVLIASETRVNNNRHFDYYAILQTEPRSEPDLIRKNYRRLALLLHPDKNKFPLADSAFKLVADAWGVLSDPAKRTPYDHELGLVLRQNQQDKLPVRRSTVGIGVVLENNNNNNSNTPTPNPTSGMNNINNNNNNIHSRGGGGTGQVEFNFWTTCPYCYVLYQYPRVYKECCLRCQNCERAFHAAVIPSLPPMVPGKEAYYCCWGFFPLGFSFENGGKGKKVDPVRNNNGNVAETMANTTNDTTTNNTGFPNWMPGMFATGPTPNVSVRGVVDFSDGSGSGGFGSAQGSKKRGRPRKNPLGF